MSNRDRVANVLLRYAVDKRSAREATQENDNQIQAINSLARGADKVTRKLQQIEKAQDNLRAAFRSGKISTEQFEKSFDKLDQSARKLNKSLDRLEKPRSIDFGTALQRQQDRFDTTSRNVSLAGDFQSNLGALSGLSSAAGASGLGQGIAGIGEVVVLAEELPRLKEALVGLPQTIGSAVTALGPVGLGLAAAIAALGVAAFIASKGILEAKSAYESSLESLKEFNRFKLDATTEQVTARVAELEKDRQAISETLDTLKAAGELSAETNPILAATVKQLGGYNNAVSTLEKEQGNLTTELSYYTRGLQENVFAVNDATTAQEAYNERLRAAISGESSTRIQTNLFLADVGTTSEDVDKKLTRLNDELKLVGAEIENNTLLTAEDRTGLIERYNALQQEIGTLKAGRAVVDERTASAKRLAEGEKVLLDLEKRREASTRDSATAILGALNQQAASDRQYAQLGRTATTEQTTARLQALQDERDSVLVLIEQLKPLARTNEVFATGLIAAQQNLAGLNRDIERTFGEVAPAAIARLQDDIRSQISDAGDTRDVSVNTAGDERAKGLQDAASELASGLADLDADFAKQQQATHQERIKALSDFQRDEQKRVTDHQKELARIQRDSQDDIRNAALRLDASGVRAAQQQRDRELEDRQSQFDEETDAASQRLEDIKRNASDERRELIQSYQERRNDLIRANREEVSALNQKYRAEVAAANQAYQTQVSQLQQKLQIETQLITQAYQAQLAAAKQFADQSAALAKQAQASLAKSVIQQAPKAVTSTAKDAGKLLGGLFSGIFAEGTSSVPQTGLALVHQGERIIPADQNERITRMLEGRGGFASGSGGMVINIPIYGNLDNVTVKQLRSEINSAFEQLPAALGV